MPVLESWTLGEIAKWVVGVILIPYLWYQHKRVDKLNEVVNKDHYTKEETKEQIGLRLQPIRIKLDLIYDELKSQRRNSD